VTLRKRAPLELLCIIYSMSSAIASARKRRAPNEQPPARPGFDPRQQQQQQQQAQNSQVGLTLPQVIALVDKRLTALETSAKTTSAAISAGGEDAKVDIPENLNAILEEYNNRHEILGNEIQSIMEKLEELKTTILKVQTYTMDVNKKLVDHLLSNVESTGAGAEAEAEAVV